MLCDADFRRLKHLGEYTSAAMLKSPGYVKIAIRREKNVWAVRLKRLKQHLIIAAKSKILSAEIGRHRLYFAVAQHRFQSTVTNKGNARM